MRRIQISALGLILLVAMHAAARIQVESPESIIQRAVQMQQAGDFAGAAQAYREALKTRPDDVATHVNYGVVLVKLGEFDDAIAQYQAAEKFLPGDPRIALNIALAYEKSGRLPEAMDRFEKLHALAPQDQQVTMLLADSYLQLGRDDKVIELLKPLADQRPDDLGMAYMLGTALLHKQRIQEGEVFLDRILRNGDTAEARFLLGTRMYESGDYPASVKELGRAIDLNPNLPQLQSLYGRALLNTGDPDAAAQAFRHELEANPNDFEANLGLAQILTVRGKYDEAAPRAKRALLSRPDSAEAELTIAESLNGLRQFQNARPYAQAATKAMPASIKAHEVLASVYRGLGLQQESARERSKARSRANEADPGPEVNKQAPEFELASTTSAQTQGPRDFRGKSPLVLVFGSYSCPNFRGSAEALTSLYHNYGTRIPFLLIYIREAHAQGDWQSTRNERDDIALAPANTFAEKQEHASMCTRKLHLPFPSLVDGMDGTVEKAYNAWPSRVFVVGRDGRIEYRTRLTELDFHPAEMEAALRDAIGVK